MDTPSPEPSVSAGGPPRDGRMLAFTIESREYALPLAPIVEITRYAVATPVPHPEPAIEGILPLRGRMVTLLDVRRFLSRPARTPGSTAQVIVVEISGDLLGLVVDSVSRVLTAGTPTRPPSVPGDFGRPGLFGGALTIDDAEVLLLDLEALLRGIA